MNKDSLKHILKKFLSLIPMLILISIVIFGALQLTPGNPLTYQIPPELLSSSTFDLEAYEKAMGLDATVYVQYFRWIWNILRGELGYSLVSGAPIVNMLRTRLPATMELALCGILISSVFGICLGILAAIKQNTLLDYGCTALSVLAISIPEFFMGIIGITIFSLKLGWLPTGGRLVYGDNSFGTRLAHLILPAVVMGLALTGALMRHTRGSLLDVLTRDYIKTARSKGLSERKVYLKHAFRNALIPVTVLLCFRIPGLVGGSVVIESVFGWPGMGGMLLDAISGKDYPVVMITAMIIAFVTLIASFLADLFTTLLDPRVDIER